MTRKHVLSLIYVAARTNEEKKHFILPCRQYMFPVMSGSEYRCCEDTYYKWLCISSWNVRPNISELKSLKCSSIDAFAHCKCGQFTLYLCTKIVKSSTRQAWRYYIPSTLANKTYFQSKNNSFRSRIASDVWFISNKENVMTQMHGRSSDNFGVSKSTFLNQISKIKW